MTDLTALHNEGVALRKAGRLNAALDAFERALALGATAIETRIMRAHVLGDLARFDEAISDYRLILADDPTQIDVHETLSSLLPQLGRSSEALHAYHDALRISPGTGMIWVSAMAAAKAQGAYPELLEWARAAEARFGPDSMVTVMEALAMSGLGDDTGACALLERAIAANPNYAPAYTSLAHVQLRLGHVHAAEAPALEAVRRAPTNQAAWALLAIIWRATGNVYEHWLADYEKLVIPIDLADFDKVGVMTALNARHLTLAHPGDQSLRGGTQTRGILFDLPDPAIQDLAGAIKRAVESRLAKLPFDSKHPFLGRNTGVFEFQGSWSVRLRGQGHHISHIHQEGWLSSALYINLPREMLHSDQGALVFGIPDAALKLDLPPRRKVLPREGMLVVFPSYFWHGTLPFDSAEPRLTVAFDAVPQPRTAFRSISRV